MQAKQSSLLAQVTAALWVAAMSVLKGLGKINMEMTDIILSGGAIAAVFSPVFVSIWREKIWDINWGVKNGG
jgi:ABC-type nickel/cobalt efflux system permease component RcnA